MEKVKTWVAAGIILVFSLLAMGLSEQFKGVISILLGLMAAGGGFAIIKMLTKQKNNDGKSSPPRE